ncbi:hypothetical protein [Streptomyces sp. NPDC005093]|jgi:hypothetical protein
MPGRALAFYGSVAMTSILSLILLNLAADKTGIQGLQTLRDYTVRRNG